MAASTGSCADAPVWNNAIITAAATGSLKSSIRANRMIPFLGLARLPSRRCRHECASLAVDCTIVAGREVAELHGHGAGRGIHVNVLPLQTDRGIGIACAHHPPLRSEERRVG